MQVEEIIHSRHIHPITIPTIPMITVLGFQVFLQHKPITNENGSFKGISGIAGGWGIQKGVSLMVLRDGGLNPILSLTAQAIQYAAQNGARVINISSGFLPSNPDLSVLTAAINSAVNGYGVVIVASAGNSGSTGGILQ